MKKSVVKMFSVLLALVLLTSGCGSAKTEPAANATTTTQAEAKPTEAPKEVKPVELTLWHETEPGIANVLSEQLKKLEPEIKVNVVRKEKVTDALKLVAGDPNSAPDLFWYAHDKIGMLATMGVLEPLDQYITPDKFDNFIPMTKQAGTFDGKTYQVPAYFETLLFLYNKKLLDKAPATTDELLAMMKEKTKGGNYGFVEQHSTAYYAAAWINAYGGFIVNEKSEPGLDKPETIEALTYHKQFVPLMPKDGEWNTVTTLFKEGKAASTINGPWLVPDLRKSGMEIGFAPLPVIPKINKPLSPFAGVQGVMLLKASKNKEAAVKVLNALLTKDLGEAISLATGAAPAHKQAYENDKIKNDELINVMKAIAENATPMPNVAAMDVMWGTSEAALVAINKKGGDVKAELEKAQKESLKTIADMK